MGSCGESSGYGSRLPLLCSRKGASEETTESILEEFECHAAVESYRVLPYNGWRSWISAAGARISITTAAVSGFKPESVSMNPRAITAR